MASLQKYMVCRRRAPMFAIAVKLTARPRPAASPLSKIDCWVENNSSEIVGFLMLDTTSTFLCKLQET